jgi:hypothetical protein
MDLSGFFCPHAPGLAIQALAKKPARCVSLLASFEAPKKFLIAASAAAHRAIQLAG